MSASSEPLSEPWMRGPIEGVDVLIAPVLYAFQHAREDLRKHTEGLSAAQLWAKPFGFGSVAFHIQHIGGSAERLLSYLRQRDLSPEQFAALEREKQEGAQSREELLAELEQTFAAAEQVVRGIDPAILRDARTIGRQKLPTTVIGLLTHIAEHTQRHVGQAISAAKLARVCNNVP